VTIWFQQEPLMLHIYTWNHQACHLDICWDPSTLFLLNHSLNNMLYTNYDINMSLHRTS
jgi:hypothetical protein